eukprot:m.34216 g.34216  ORF g.34216 m.34216 type:complete len:467 (+) comp10655_c0_seq1:249-1649(+)
MAAQAAPAPALSRDELAQHDLTSTMAHYLDRHLVLPLLEFLQTKDVYDKAALQQGKLELLSETNMIDFATDIHKELHPDSDPPAALLEKRKDVVSKLRQFEQESTPVVELFQKEDVLHQIEIARDGNELIEYLQEHHDFQPEMLDTLYENARFQFDCGNYDGATQYLLHYRVLSNDPQKSLSALWGKLASEILTEDWDAAFDDLMTLKETIDDDKQGATVSPLQQLQQRTWLIHWSLFVCFNHPNTSKGREELINMFLYTPEYANTIQTVCPHVLRYLTTAVITNNMKQRRRGVLKDLVKVIQQESYTYKDPMTELLACLYVKFDFDGAQQKLRECEDVLRNDFFLVSCQEEFMENARLFIFETYCRIHNTISISMLAEKLNMTPDKAEEWIVNLIRNAQLDAKIDSQEGHVVMATQVPSIYHQVIEQTKSLMFRSHVIGDNLKKPGQGGKGGGRRREGGHRGQRQ